MSETESTDLNKKIKETLAGLKDFQLKTVEYVYEQLYKKGRNKMLVADEVGLGKTIVAKGLIAKAFKRFKPDRKKPVFNVIYICSNQALAKQNLSKLNFTANSEAVDYSEDDDRVTGLAYESQNEDDEFPFRIKAFTPATSFDDKTTAGKADERILLYRLLYTYSDLQTEKNSLKWILKGNRRIHDDTWEKRISDAEDFDKGRPSNARKIRHRVFEKFRKELGEVVKPEELKKCFQAAGLTYEVKYWTLLKRLCQLGIRKNNYEYYPFIRELVSSLRFKLSKVCLDYLQADIFILDEFQRYKQLIAPAKEDDEETLTPAIELAREIFSMENSKIIMLSATPFKPYTNEFDELTGEIHYQEFRNVLQFLMKEKGDPFWNEYEKDRKTFFSFLRHPDTLRAQRPEALELKGKLENLYRGAMVRTEKLLVSADRDALIKKIIDKPVSIQPEDINDFVVFDQITQVLNEEHRAALPTPLEYVKSSPYALSFLDHYQHKEKIRELLFQDSTLPRLLRKTRHAWVDLEAIHEYRPLIPTRGNTPPNAKLRLLLEETVHNIGWKLLWIPPSIPYYELSGPFANSYRFSKTLIFSSWKLVPRMVASLVSYEAERLSVGNKKSVSTKEQDEKHTYFQKKRSPRPQFTFKVEKEQQDPSQMTSFMLMYPALFLAKFYDPAINVSDGKPLRDLKADLGKRLRKEFKDLNLNQYVTGKGDWLKWFWLAPLLFDKASEYSDELAEWFTVGNTGAELSLLEDDDKTSAETASARTKHFAHAKSLFLKSEALTAPRLNDEQITQVCNHLANMILGSPAVCYIRSQLRHHPLSVDILDGAYNVGSSFLTMFNKPESIAIVRLHTEETDYWQRVLQYLVDGNAQAMLDEFVYLLSNGENVREVRRLADHISDILSMRTANIEVDDLRTFIENASQNKKNKRSMRSHYAVDFGTQKISTAKGAGRMINIRQAFNSPFRPFVLASTSIGQEGLDFHLYCKKIFHWNLPSNPIDFEQREGRIHRYQGLVIRLNLADKYKHLIRFTDGRNEVWKELFGMACREKEDAHFPCDLVPFWHTESKSDIKIERYVPLYPFSRDLEKYRNLIRILTFYRLTFGQPRQGELIDALHGMGFGEEEIKQLDELIINLTPIRFYNG